MISWLLVTLNLLLLIIPALVLYTVILKNRRQAGEHLLDDLRSGGMLVHELPKQCPPVELRVHEQRLTRARWSARLLAGENPLWLYQESGLEGRLVCTWRSKSQYPVNLVITANGGLAKRSSPELFPRRGRGWRQKRGFNRIKLFVAGKGDADEVLTATDLTRSFLRISAAWMPTFWYLHGDCYLLIDPALVSSGREAQWLAEAAKSLEFGLGNLPKQDDGSADILLDPRIAPAALDGKTLALSPGPVAITAEIWHRFSTMAWVWFPYSIFSFFIDKMRGVLVQLGFTFAFSLILYFLIRQMRQHYTIASSGFSAVCRYVNKDWDSDSDGSSHWVDFVFKDPEGREVSGKCSLYHEEWKQAGPDWRKVIHGHGNYPGHYLYPDEMIFLPRDR